ncbi:MAG: hypothetical protein HOP15_04920 [Planctomycetes bacterium]|nr:hypothetical protein [Planctomycetota bacterium]
MLKLPVPALLGASLLALCTSAMFVLAAPTNFQAQVVDGADKVSLTWNSNAPKVRVFVQKQVTRPNGSLGWETQSGSAALGELAYPRNMDNTGSHVVNTHATVLGTYRFSIKAKNGVNYSDSTPWIVRTGLH